MTKKLLALLMGVIMVFAMTACGGGSDTSASEEIDMTSITADADAGTVTIYAQTNGIYCNQSTMHGIVFQDGGAGGKCMFVAQCDSQDFYNAMVEAGGTPWCTDGKRLQDGEFTDGQKVDITVTWDGQEEPVALQDMVKTSDGGNLEGDFRFSGNQQGNEEAGSGCITCLNSCWAGIISNAAYPFGAIDSGNPTAMLNDEVAPQDGTIVKITFTLK